MKKNTWLNLSLVLSVAAALTALTVTGCGGSSEDPKDPSNVGVAGSPVIAAPQQNPGYPNGTYTVPTGIYWYINVYGQVVYQSCPQNFTQTGPNVCTYNSGTQINCGNGLVASQWGACVPQGLVCPPGFEFSYTYGGCVGYSNVSSIDFSCTRYGIFTVCRFTRNSPRPGCYFNGWGWVPYQ